MKGLPKVLGLIFCGILNASTPAFAHSHPLAESLEGPKSAYTPILLELAKNWAKSGTPREFGPALYNSLGGNPLKMVCVATSGNSFYIGLKQFMRVQAPLEKVEAVLDDIAHYKDLFPDYDDIHVISRDDNYVLTYWEQHIPLFFVPNAKYEIGYIVDKSNPNLALYRYQLHKGDSLKTNDGLIIVEREPGGTSRYSEFDYYDANWGVAKALGVAKIWRESAEGLYASDVAVKIKAEHPEWSYSKIADDTAEILKKYPVDPVIQPCVP